MAIGERSTTLCHDGVAEIGVGEDEGSEGSRGDEGVGKIRHGKEE